MPLVKLQFQPGINRETTSYANDRGWWDCDKVRFRAGLPEKIGGWTRLASTIAYGTIRHLVPWIALDSNQYIGVGTNAKYYIFGSGTFNDITPLRNTPIAGEATFAVGRTTLNGAIDATQTTLVLTALTNFPTTGGYIKIDSEEIFYASRSGTTLSGLTRGVNGTTAASHANLATVSSATLVVTDANHGAYAGDFVTYAGAASLGGNITAAILNQEYQIAEIIDANSYTVYARTVASISAITTSTGLNPTLVYSAAGDTGTGGASTSAAYQINGGLDTSISGTGWGAGPWSRGGWGSAATVTVPGAQLRLWGGDNYGEDLIFNVRDGGVYYWNKDLAFPRGVALASLSGATYAPRIAKQIIISDNDRHVIAFGCDDEFNPGVQDPLLIRFSAQENLTDWQTLPTNTAGSLRVGSGSEIICAVEAKQQILVFTDTSVHAMQYLGPPYTFGISMISSNVSIAGPNAALAVDDAVFWMGNGEFYVYDGVVSQLPCTVKDYVFSNINSDQLPKVVAGLNPMFGEVWWFYPSAGSQENDRYVVFNYLQKLWYYGSMTRTAWTHRNEGQYPLAAGTDSYLYLHEFGNDDGSQNPAVALPAYIESSGQEIGDGDQFAFIWRMIPDLTFRNSTGTPSATMTIKASNFPGADFSQSDSRVVQKTASLPVEQFTNQLYTRLRGRSFCFRIDSTQAGVAWRLGAPRVDIRTDGKR